MRPSALFLTAALALAPSVRAQVLPAFGTDRAGSVGFQFLKLPSDARSIGQGAVGVATAIDATALFWNPALAAQTDGIQLHAARASYFEGTLFTTNYAAATYPLGSIRVGASLQTLDSGEMDVTDEFNAGGTGETFRFQDLALGASFAQRLTDLFSYGVTAKLIQERTAGLTTTTGALDVGIHYRVGETGAAMAVAIRNFGLDASPSGSLSSTDPNAPGGVVVRTEFETITLPTTFLLGLSYDLMRRSADHSLVTTAQLYRPNDNAESLGLAAEYGFRDRLMLRGGYGLGSSEAQFSVGAGLNVPLGRRSVRLDYGFTRYERLGPLHAVGFNVAL